MTVLGNRRLELLGKLARVAGAARQYHPRPAVCRRTVGGMG
jgi:hypothetical protein